MSDSTEATHDDGSEDNAGEGQGSAKSLRTELNRAIERAKNAEAERDGLKRDSAFSSVEGFDSANKTHAYFRNTYTGEANAEAIRKAAIDAGLIEDTKAKDVDNAIDAEDRLNSASTDAAPATINGSDEAALLAIANAKNHTEWVAAMKAAGRLGVDG